jgi:hypothetical protein
MEAIYIAESPCKARKGQFPNNSLKHSQTNNLHVSWFRIQFCGACHVAPSIRQDKPFILQDILREASLFSERETLRS